jgi:septum formation protein
MNILLGSASPRRRDLLAQMGLEFAVVSPDVDETPIGREDPVAYVRRLAIAKSSAITPPDDDTLVITADTTVDLGGDILGKPIDAADAVAMLRRLSARTHRVHTGVAVRRGDRLVTDVVTSLVTFVPLTSATIEWYVGTGEPLDKAGAYAIQGAGAVLVQRVRGSVSNVVGLPLHAVVRLAGELGVSLLGASLLDGLDG